MAGTTRPKAAPTSRRRGNLTIRIREEVRQAIQSRAGEHGRSLSEEVEISLEQSFHADNALGGRRTAALLRIFAETVRFCQGIGGPEDEWLDERWKFNEVVDTWNRHLEEIKPKESEADRNQRQEELRAFREAIGKAGPEGARALRDWAARNSTSAILDPEERAQWAEMATSPETGAAIQGDLQ